MPDGSNVGSDRVSPQASFPREAGRLVFAADARNYAAARPDYPDGVYEILRDRCGLRPGTRVVEIGAGTGQATRRLVAAGAEVVAIEPGAQLARLLEDHVASPGRLQVVVSDFEDVELPTGSFDLVAVATAFHWLDPARALPKIRSLLRAGGRLAAWWNVFGDPDLPDPFHDATVALLRDVVPSPSNGANGIPYALDVVARTAELRRHGFRDIEYEALRWTLVLDAPATRRLYATYSNIARLPSNEREGMLDGIERIARTQFAGGVERQMVTPIYTARVGEE